MPIPHLRFRFVDAVAGALEQQERVLLARGQGGQGGEQAAGVRSGVGLSRERKRVFGMSRRGSGQSVRNGSANDQVPNRGRLDGGSD